MNKQAMELAFKHWIDNFDGGLVVTNKVIWEAAWNAALKEAIKQQGAPEVMRVTVDTEGWQLVPKEPTILMRCAGEMTKAPISCWFAMLSAAPQYTGEKE